MRTILMTAMCALAPALAPLVTAAEKEHNHGGNMAARAAQAELGATAAFDANGVLWAAHKAEGHVAVSQSTDRGRTWSMPVRVNAAPEDTDAGGDARPKVALGLQGEVYVTWTKPLSKPFTGEIRFTRSLDGGRTFQTPITVHRDRQEITHRFDAITVNPQGQVFVAWIDKRLGVAAAATKSAYRGAAVFFAVSDDRGATFRGDFKAADHSCECCRIALVPRADGSVRAMWRHIFEPNVRDHAITVLRPDGKADAVTRVTFEDWRIDACPHHGPALAEGEGGPAHAVWFSLAPEKQGVFYGRIGDKTNEGLRQVGSESADHADVAALGKRVAVVWKEFDGEKTRLRALLSAAAGMTWREQELTTTRGASDHPKILTLNDRFLVFWNTRNEPLSVTELAP